MRTVTIFLLFVVGFLGVALDAIGAAPIPPIVDYKRGYKDRVEYIKAVIHPSNLDTGTSTNGKTRAYTKSMSPYKNDEAGHLIASRLGGTGRETYNIVPQNRALNHGLWRTRVEAPIYDAVKKGNIVTYEVWPIYSGHRATRPKSLRYLAKYQNGSKVLGGTMNNPKPAKSGDFKDDEAVEEEPTIVEELEMLNDQQRSKLNDKIEDLLSIFNIDDESE